MKKFKSPICHSDYEFSVENGVAGVRVAIAGEGDCLNMFLAPSDAPAIALAILEAAGFVGDETMFTGLAVANLRDHIEEQERVTAEAKDKAKLEAEARDFYDAYHSAADWPYQDWVMLEERYKAQFLAVARKAREMKGAGK